MKKFYLISLIFILFFAGCRKEQSRIEETPPMAEQAVEKFTITETENGKLKMILESESAQINEKTEIAVLKLPRVKFYEDGKYASLFVSESAKINLATYDVDGIGKCAITTVKNEHLQTTNMKYNAKKQMISSAEPVKITRAQETVYGDSFEADTKLENIIIRRQRVILERNN